MIGSNVPRASIAVLVVCVYTAIVHTGEAQILRWPTPTPVPPPADVTFYRGVDGPGTESSGDSNLAGVRGDRIYVVQQPSPDRCGRMFYIKGQFSMAGNQVEGPISGQMWRCTNPELIGPPCNQNKNYQVAFKGTVSMSRTPTTGRRQMIINITYYPDEKWIKDKNCKKKREDRGTEILVFHDAPLYQAYTPRDAINDAERLAVDSIVESLQNIR